MKDVTTRSTNRARGWRGATLVGVAALLVAGCGADTDGVTGTADDEPSAVGDSASEAYCELARAMADEMPTDEQLEALRDEAPEEIADDVAFVVDAILEEGPAAFGDAEVQQRIEPIDAYEAEVCGIEREDEELPEGVSSEVDPDAQQVAVSAIDYDFVFDAPTAGAVSFVMSNDGDEPHFMYVAKLVDGMTVEDALEAPEDVEVATLEAGSDLAGPGEEAVLTFENLEPGDYAMACFFPTAEGVPHAFEGMAVAFTVEAS